MFWPYDSMTSLCHLFPQPYSRCQNLTGWPMSISVLPTPDTRMVKWPLQPRSGYKREPFTQNRRCESSFPSKLDITTTLVLPPASLGHTATRASLPSVSFLAEQAVLPSSPRRWGETHSRPEEELKPSCHPWLCLWKSSSRFAGRW
jgi:hypothetical protein